VLFGPDGHTITTTSTGYIGTSAPTEQIWELDPNWVITRTCQRMQGPEYSSLHAGQLTPSVWA
jgi:hypothetical protein